MDERRSIPSVLGTWIVIFLLVVVIVLTGLFSFFLVGDHGQPSWDFRPVGDVPGESPYAMYQPLPNPQHVRGEKGD
jgi:hypothetical protein